MSIPKKNKLPDTYHPLERLQSKVSQEDIQEALDLMYDAYVRDEVAAESPHHTRIKVWEIYQELGRFFKSIFPSTNEESH